MVLLAVRTGDAADSSRFLCNALTSHHVQEVVESVVAVHNMRLRLQASVAACTVGAKRPRSEDEAALTAAGIEQIVTVGTAPRPLVSGVPVCSVR